LFAVVFVGSRTFNTLAKPLIGRRLQVTVTVAHRSPLTGDNRPK